VEGLQMPSLDTEADIWNADEQDAPSKSPGDCNLDVFIGCCIGLGDVELSKAHNAARSDMAYQPWLDNDFASWPAGKVLVRGEMRRILSCLCHV
jgi:hypothetical protein